MLAGVEWEKPAVDTLRKRLANKWNYKNVKEKVLHFDIQRTEELLHGYSDSIYGDSQGLISLIGDLQLDAIIGGPPCQAYSVAGRIRDENGMHDDYRNFLFESYLNVVKAVKPKACIFENVPGMLSASPGGIPIIERITDAFEESGYAISKNIKQQAVFDLSHFGVPQARKRVIIAAFSREQFDNSPQLVDDFYQNLKHHIHAYPKTVEQGIGDLGTFFPSKNPTKKVSHEKYDETKLYPSDHCPRYHNQRDIKIFRLLAEDIESGELNYISSESLKELYTKMTGKTSSVHKYHVLRKNKPSNTIPAHLYKDGLRHIHPDPKQARTLTVREAARLQAFDDDFEFCGSNGAKYKMIGNAVPPTFAKYIALSLASTLKY